MKSETVGSILVLLAVGIVTPNLSQAAPSWIPNCWNPALGAPDGDVRMTSAQLQNAVAGMAPGTWLLTVHRSAVTGIQVPASMISVQVRLTTAQRNAALVDANANGGSIVLGVRSEQWVDDMEANLLGGFGIEFDVAFCDYNNPDPWS